MMCVACHCVFDWNSGAEVTKGPIHNPHFHDLSEEARAKVIAERASRGITTNAEERFVAGVGGCAHDFDLLCGNFVGTEFRRAVGRAFPETDPVRYDLLELYRIIVHFESVELPNERQNVGHDENGELPMRLNRVARLRGHGLTELCYVSKHPSGFSSMVRFMRPGTAIKPMTETNYVCQLMRIDTYRRYANERLEIANTFVDAGKDMMRVLCATPASERKQQFYALRDLYLKTLKMLAERPTQSKDTTHARDARMIESAIALRKPYTVALHKNADFDREEEAQRRREKREREEEAQRRQTAARLLADSDDE